MSSFNKRVDWISVSWTNKGEPHPHVRMFYSDIWTNQSADYKQAAEKWILEKRSESNIENVTVKIGSGTSSHNVSI